MSSRKLQTVIADFISTTTMSKLAPLMPPPAAALPAGIAEQLADVAFGKGLWQEAWGHYLSALRSGEAVVDVAKCLLFGARCALYLGEFRAAQKLLAEYTDAFPQDPEGLFYLGRALQGAHRDFDALNAFTAAAQINAGRPKYLAAVAQTAHSIAFQGFGYAADAPPSTYLAIAKAALSAALAKDGDHLETLTEQILLALDTGDIDAAIAVCNAVAEKADKHGAEKVGGITTTLALALIRGGLQARIAEVTFLKSYAPGRRLLARAGALASDITPVETSKSATILSPGRYDRPWMLETLGTSAFNWPRQQATVASPADSVSVDCDFVVPLRNGGRGELLSLAARSAALPPQFAGLVSFVATAAPGSRDPAMVRDLFIRKSFWNELVAANPAIGWPEITVRALDRLKLFVVPQGGTISGLEWPAPATEAKTDRPRVMVLSRHGPRLVGGGEQFLRIAGQSYAADQRADVFFAGLSKDWTEVRTDWPDDGNFSMGFVHEDIDAFRSFCLANNVTAIHVISGLGEFVLDACRGLDIKLIYGVHFWREFIPARVLSRPYYPNVRTDEIVALPAMNEILARADYVYVNSDFCADISRQTYKWSPPIIYSVPVSETLEAPPTLARSERKFVLLANARADKGWYLLLDIAERLPQHSFVAIAGQSDRDAALSDVHRRGLYNVEVLDRTDDMDALYAQSSIVLVPSFVFVETFSRVVIEAGRMARPVLMADSGNLPYLGAGTDLVLPDDANAWARRIDDLLTKPKAYAAAVKQSVGIAKKYTAKSLVDRLRRVPVLPATPRILVCAGSGIGNICHVSPMVEKLANHYGAPIDMLVAGDFEGSSAAMAGSPHVGQVFETFAHVEQRQYDIVLVTHSFGTVVPSFNAYRVLSSRDFAAFDPGGEWHEARFNLDFLRQALGIEAADADIEGYFFGGLDAAAIKSEAGTQLRIGLHAGSKGGIWASKRWPGFAGLAGQLIARGAEVLSVGIKSEYVEGTLDKTDLSIARMAEELSTCDAVISNDSGIMNIANALGIPLVALFGPTNAATRGPLNSNVRILKPQTECSPCEAHPKFKSRFADGKCQCISLIDEASVLAALVDLGINLSPRAV